MKKRFTGIGGVFLKAKNPKKTQKWYKELLQELKKEGVEFIGETEEFEYGKFGWIMDPNGYKIELWRHNNGVFPMG